MLGRTSKHWWGVVLDAPDPHALARFYADLMDWKIVKDEPNSGSSAGASCRPSSARAVRSALTWSARFK
jgi:hypothetical protein